MGEKQDKEEENDTNILLVRFCKFVRAIFVQFEGISLSYLYLFF